MNTKLNNEFASELLPSYPLDVAITWISSNLDPQDVFTEDQLGQWAENNGYILNEE